MAGESLRYMRGGSAPDSFSRGYTPFSWSRTYDAATSKDSLPNWFWDPDQNMFLNRHEALGRASRYSPDATGLPVYGRPGASAPPVDTASLYRPLEIIKSPAVASATGRLMDQANALSAAGIPDFNAVVSRYRGATDRAFDLGNQATDISGVSGALRGAQSRYSSDLGAASAGYRDINTDIAARERGIVGRAWDETALYDAAKEKERELALTGVTRFLSRYQTGANAAAGGAPMGASGYVADIGNRAAYEAMLPIDLAKINRRYDVLTGLELPVERDIAGRETTRVSQFEPMIAGQRYQTETGVETQIQALKQQVAGLSWENASRYMQSLGVPVQLQQQILSGNIGLMGQLAGLEEGSRYRGLEYVPGANVTPTASYNMNNPPYPVYPRNRYDVGPASGGPGGPNPNDPNYAYYERNPKGWTIDPNTKMLVYRGSGVNYVQPNRYSGDAAAPGYNPESRSDNPLNAAGVYYDANLQAWVNSSTGEIVRAGGTNASPAPTGTYYDPNLDTFSNARSYWQ